MPRFPVALLLFTLAIVNVSASAQNVPIDPNIPDNPPPGKPEIIESYDFNPGDFVYDVEGMVSTRFAKAQDFDPTDGYKAIDLSTPSNANLSSITNGDEIFPPCGVRSGSPEPSFNIRSRYVIVEYTVKNGDTGAPGSAIDREINPLPGDPLPDGTGSDTFGVRFSWDAITLSWSRSPAFLMTDHLQVEPDWSLTTSTPQSFETDLDALGLAWPKYPVYWTAYDEFNHTGVLSYPGGLNTRASDITAVDSPGGTPYVVPNLSISALGLSPSDVIDALSMNISGDIVFSLQIGSPFLNQTGPAGEALDGCTLFFATAPGTPASGCGTIGNTDIGIWCLGADLDLTPQDELQGVNIIDPWTGGFDTGNTPRPDVMKARSLEQASITTGVTPLPSPGGPRRRITVSQDAAWELHLCDPGNELTYDYVCFLHADIPTDYTTLLQMRFVFDLFEGAYPNPALSVLATSFSVPTGFPTVFSGLPPITPTRPVVITIPPLHMPYVISLQSILWGASAVGPDLSGSSNETDTSIRNSNALSVNVF